MIKKKLVSILLMLSMVITLHPTLDVAAADTIMTLEAGKSYEIVNSSKERFDLKLDADFEYEDPLYDYANYFIAGYADFGKAYNGDLYMDDRMKKRITVVGKYDLDIIIPAEALSSIKITETSKPALYHFTLKAGKNYELENLSKDPILVQNNTDLGLNSRFAQVKYNIEGEVNSFYMYDIGNIGLDNREKIRMSINEAHDMECWILYEFKDILRVQETAMPALYFFTLEAGKSYELVNLSDKLVVMHNNTDFGSNLFAQVKYNIDGEVNYFDKGDSGNIGLDNREKIRMTVSIENDMECWMPYESKDILKVNETTMPALYFFTLEAGKSYEIVNLSDKPIVMHNDADLDYKHRFDYTYYLPDGEKITGEDSSGYISMYENSKSLVKVGDIYDLECWIPYDHGVSVTGIPIPAEGYLSNKLTPIQTSVTPVQNTQTPISTTPYIYDIDDPGTGIILPADKLDTVTDLTSAVSLITSAAEMMTPEQKASATGVDIVSLFAEEASAQAASKTVAGSGILINQATVQELQSMAASTRTAAETALSSAGITLARQLNAGVKFKTAETKSVTITIEPSATNTSADNVRVETSGYEISLSAEAIKANAGDSPLVITITENSTDSNAGYYPIVTASASNRFYGFGSSLTAMAVYNGKTYKITFNKPVTENIKVSLPPAAGDTDYQAVTKSDGTAIGGKYNPATGMLDVKIKNSDTYTVKDNKKDFSDIQNKSKEMQQAIRVMASKGIINGTSATTFGPEGTITRAEIAALIVRTLSKLDPNANGGFTDVKSSDWYYGAVGSAKKFGIINGTSATTFAPKANIKKDQIVAVSARTLRAEMKYKNPSDVEKWLEGYTDRSDIPDWGNTDIALATRENLVVKRTDGKLLPSGTMTRGDAAIILYRMFMKIW